MFYYVYLFYFFPISIHKLFVVCNYCNRDRFIHNPTCLVHPAIGSIVLTPPSTPSTSIPVYPRILSNTSDDCCFDHHAPSTSTSLIVFDPPNPHHMFARITVAKFKSYTVEDAHNDRATTRYGILRYDRSPHITTIRSFPYIRKCTARLGKTTNVRRRV